MSQCCAAVSCIACRGVVAGAQRRGWWAIIVRVGLPGVSFTALRERRLQAHSKATCRLISQDDFCK